MVSAPRDFFRAKRVRLKQLCSDGRMEEILSKPSLYRNCFDQTRFRRLFECGFAVLFALGARQLHRGLRAFQSLRPDIRDARFACRVCAIRR